MNIFNSRKKLIYMGLIMLVLSFMLIFLPDMFSSNKKIDKVSYINDYKIENNNYEVIGDAPWIGIIFDKPIRCDRVIIKYKQVICDTPVKVFYSTGDGFSEEMSIFKTVKLGDDTLMVDLPNNLYSELRIDIKKSFELDYIEIEQYGQYDRVVKLFGIFIFLVALICLGKVALCCEKLRCFLKNNYVAILLFGFLEIIFISYSANLFMCIENKDIISYSLSTEYNVRSLESIGTEYIYDLDISDELLVQYQFIADILSGSGEIGWRLYQNEVCITEGVLQGDNYREGRYIIDFNNSKMDLSTSYKLGVIPLNDTMIQVYVDEDNYLQSSYYYMFNHKNIMKTLIVFVNVVISAILIALLSNINLYIKYWILAISMGILSIIIVIPCSTADEFRHFARAYSIANGEFATLYDEEGNGVTEIPENLYNYRYIAPQNTINWEDETNFTINLSRLIYYLKFEDTDETINTKLVGVSGKGIAEYLPQVIAMWIGKILNVRQVWNFYLARIGNWVAISILWFIAIRIVPKYKNLYIILYSMPTNIVYSCTSSTDGLLNALIVLAFSIAIKAYYDKIPLTNKKLLVVNTLIATYISIIKLPYVLSMYVFVILNNSFNNLRENYKKVFKNFIIVTGICVIGYFITNLLVRGTQINFTISSQTNSTKEHIIYAVENVFRVCYVFVQTYIDDFKGYYNQALSVNSLNIDIVVIPYSLLMVYAAIGEDEKKQINKVQTVMLLSMSFIMWGFIILAAYFWSAVGAVELWGIQGRYMCSIIMILAIILAMRSENRKCNHRYMVALGMSIVFVAMIKIFQIQWL